MRKKKEEKQYSDFANVVNQNMFLAWEEFPEGSYGQQDSEGERPVTNKDTPWVEGQTYISNFTYEDRTLHQDIPREYPGTHPTHDNPDEEQEPPYEDYTP